MSSLVGYELLQWYSSYVYKILIVRNVGGIDYKIYISLGLNIPFKSAVLLANHYITSWTLKFHLHQVRQVAKFQKPNHVVCNIFLEKMAGL